MLSASLIRRVFDLLRTHEGGDLAATLAWGILFVCSCIAGTRIAHALYQVPDGRTFDEVEKTVTDDIPEELKKATCGYPVSVNEDDMMTKVKGVPLKPDEWRKKSTGEKEEYPKSAKGKVFSIYKQHPKCMEVRAKDPLCTQPDGDPKACIEQCDDMNEKMRYRVSRISACYVYYPDFDEEGNIVGCSPVKVPTENPAISPDCNTCPEPIFGCPPSEPAEYAYVGEKYQCTGNYPEEMDKSPDDGTSYLHVPYGWVWSGGSPDIIMPSRCRDMWIGEKKEYKNCMPCEGTECRTGEGTTPPVEDPPFEPMKEEGESKLYESFYRRYVATHELAKIPGVTADENGIQVKLACYRWYNEKMDPNVSAQRACIAADLQLEKLKKRTMEGDPEFNKDDELPEKEQYGGFSLDPDHKDDSLFVAPKLPETKPRPPFGETPKYVTVMQQLEKRMEGYPPTVQLIMPLVSVQDEVAALFQKNFQNQASSSSAPLVDVTVPLQPGLLEAVRETLRHSVLSRLEEKPIPVVIPLLSDAEIQAQIHAWEGWKEERTLRDKSTEDVDAKIIEKLKQYRKNIEQYRAMRNELPDYLASILSRRRQLSTLITSWVDTQMTPYTNALAQRDKVNDLLQAWNEMKKAYASLGQTNAEYCKADATTPPLPWIELPEEFPLPDFPAFPRHLVFDFSNIFYAALDVGDALSVPVLQPVQVALTIPSPPDPTLDREIPTLPDLPEVPTLPEPVDDPLNVQWDSSDVPPNPPPFPAEELAKNFRDLAGKLSALESSYKELLWIKKKHEDFKCPNPGSNDCVFPETKLWHVFMRIWSPVGALMEQGDPPPGAVSSASSASSTPAWCDGRNDDQCRLGEFLIKRGLRVTLPKPDEGRSSSGDFGDLRIRMRQITVDDEGKMVSSAGSAPPYDIEVPQDLYEAYPVPAPFILEPRVSSSSSYR